MPEYPLEDYRLKRILIHLIVSVLAVNTLFSTETYAAGPRLEAITVAYFLNWPTPNQFAQINQTYDAALGLKVNWKAFESSTAMTAAMATGDVQIAYALSHVAFVVSADREFALTMIGVALDYTANDNCIVAAETGISRVNAHMLEGRKIAIRRGSVSHFRLLKVLKHLGVDSSRVEIVPVPDSDAMVEALRGHEVAMVCTSGGTLHALQEHGSPLMDATEQAAIGLKLFDVIAVSTEFMDRHPRIVQDFMEVTEAANIQWRKNPDPMRATIARAANMVQASSDLTLRNFSFPSAAEQKSDDWMGQQVPDYLKQIADFFVQHRQLERSLESYDQLITTRFLR